MRFGSIDDQIRAAREVADVRCQVGPVWTKGWERRKAFCGVDQIINKAVSSGRVIRRYVLPNGEEILLGDWR